MDEHRQLLFVNQFLPSNEQKLIDRFREAATRRFTRPPEVTTALQNVPMDSFQDVVIGPRYVGVLFTDGQIGRYPYVATCRPLEPSASPASTANEPSTASAPSGGAASASGGAGSGGTAAGGASAAAGSFLQRAAKFRRYEGGIAMMHVGGAAARGRDHRSVIIDRARPLMPAANVPEDLIAQAQVVLQGKSREVIIRELQRTNLNVNEAVNNLLSRDDDDDDGSEGADINIPEELLNLLDNSHGGVLESDLYPPDSFEYLMSSRERRNKNEKDKEKQKSTKAVIEPDSDTESPTRYEIPTGSIVEPWEGMDNKDSVLGQTPRFTYIACTQSELLAISTDGKLYGWRWSDGSGDYKPHEMFDKMKLAEGEVVTHISACSLRVAVMTSAGRIATWLDTVSCGDRLSEALFVPPQKLHNDQQLEQLIVSNQLAVARFPNNVFYWCGLYPVNDRRRIFEKARTRQRKHVTFDTTQIVEGSEVRTKSGPIYSIGCIAANLSGVKPMLGILMENAWSLSEVCRFRLLDPASYDLDRYDPSVTALIEPESRDTSVAQQALASGNRKRPATDEVFGAEPKLREEPWPISDVIFIHEEVQNDTAIVKIVDGGHCAVEYQDAAPSPTDAFATNGSKQLASKGDKDKPNQRVRLIRKDELTVVSQKIKYARSPKSMRVEPYRFVLSGSTATKRVISAVADSLGIRALVERRGVASIVRVSVCGKTLTSHVLPLHAPSLHSIDGRKPTLMNYGDDSILLIRDAHGGMIPLVRDAAAGFREPSYLQLSSSPIVALTVKNAKEKDRPSWAPKATREAVIISLQGTHPRTLERQLPSLLYAVMCCDEKAVKALLDALEKEEDLDLSKREIVDARADGNRNVVHVAVMNAFAIKNALEADVENPVDALTTKESRSSADKVRATLDKKWNEMLKTNRSSSASAAAAAAAASAAVATDSTQPATDSTQDPTSASASSDVLEVPPSQIEVEIKMEIEETDTPPLKVKPSPVEHPKKRQENAIAIVKMLVSHPICIPFMSDLLGCRDIHGQTPFMAAVNHRAYSAARLIFDVIKEHFVLGTGFLMRTSSMPDPFMPFIFPLGSRPDDSPLFILCYNDSCSFTWTGEEHIHQDIFECRTCGLTGSLCCCTECAFTCHRNHDCKLKRTSPTAYCDCWEKSCCNALVNGNQFAREDLFSKLVLYTSLYKMLNGRGEHILLYLARKLARQFSEQWTYTHRPRRIHPPPSTAGRHSHVPEHDLDPPKFAREALVEALRNWTLIRSLAMMGVRQMDHSMPIAEEIFHLNAQNGSSHLDKFMLLLLTKCSEESNMYMENLIRVLTVEHNKARNNRGVKNHGPTLEEVNFVISRFVRSVARLFILAVITSSIAASTAVSGVIPSKDLVDRPRRTAISFTVLFDHVKKETKDVKLKNMRMFIVRCRAFFDHFSLFALHEMAQLADASLAPVRTGILRPCISLTALLGPTADSLENLEKYVNAEPDMTQQMMGLKKEGEEGEKREERKEAKKRRKRSSRRDTDREEPASERTEGTGGASGAGGGSDRGAEGADRATFRAPPPAAADSSDSESDSDSDGEGFSSRRQASQSSALATNEDARNTSRNPRRVVTANDIDVAGMRMNSAERLERLGAIFGISDEDEEESESDGEQRENDDDEDDDEDEEEDEGPRLRPDGSGIIPHWGDTPMNERGIRPVRDDYDAQYDSDNDSEEPSSPIGSPIRLEPAADRGERGRDNAERERDASSPEYSSVDEGDEHNRDARRNRRRRRENAADEAAAEGRPQPPPQGERNADAVDEVREEREEQRDEDGDVDMVDEDQVGVEMDEARDGNEYAELEQREGSARTRPEGSAAAAAEGEGAAREERNRDEDEDEERAEEPFQMARMSVGTGRGMTTAPRRMTTWPIRVPRGRLPARMQAPARSGVWERPDDDEEEESAEGEDRLNNRRNATADASRPAHQTERGSVGGRGVRARGSWGYRRTTLPPWISRGVGESEGRRAARARAAERAERAEGEGEGEGEGESGSSSEEKKTEAAALKEDETPTTLKTAIQLSTAFSFAVRVIDDLLPIVAAGSTHAAEHIHRHSNSGLVGLHDIEKLKDIDEKVRRRAIDHVISRLDDSWRWLAVVLDHSEAQIKYINAVTSTEESKKKESKERKKNQRKKNSQEGGESSSGPSTGALTSSPPSASKAKRETIACLLGVLRSHSGEAGDDLPMIDLETLRAPALVVDSYLGFVEAKEEAEKLFKLSTEVVSFFDTVEGGATPRKDKEEEPILGMRKFFQRSNSVSFPGVSFTDAHDTLQLPCGEALPIVERPQLLTSTVEKEVIFGPPPSTQEKTKEEHDKVIRAHGVSHPHNLSLTAAPIPSHQLFVDPTVITITSVTSTPVKMEEGTNDVRSPKSKRAKKRGFKGDVKQSKSVPSEDVIVIEDDDAAESSKDVDESSSRPVVSLLKDEGPPDGFEEVTYEEILETFKGFREHPIRKLMGRWRFTLQLMARELHADLTDTLGGDLSGSRLLRELAGFDMKQHELRVKMEKFRSTATKDLSFEVHRDERDLVRETCFQLNKAYTRRMALKGTERSSAVNSKKDEPLPVMASHKVKVKFIDEPGEGTGVARSFYTALANAFCSLRSLPFSDYGYKKGNDEYLYGGPMPTDSSSGSSGGTNSGRRIALVRGRDTFYATVMSSNAGGRRRVSALDRRIPLNYLHPPYTPTDMEQAEALNINPDFLANLREETYAQRVIPDKHPVELTDRLFILIRAIYPTAAARLTGMFLDLPLAQIILVLSDPAALRAYLGDAIDMMMANAAPTDIALLRGEEEKKKEVVATSPSSTPDDGAPLFFRPSRKAHYSPVPGYASPTRLMAFQNVGRLIGLCLMQCEMFPLRLSRHVLKYVLGRPLNWHDFAFYDPELFESFRKMIVDGCSGREDPKYIESLDMVFSMDLPREAFGMHTESVPMELHSSGNHRPVTKDNIVEYVYRCVEQRLLGKNNRMCLDAIKRGVHDVVPPSLLDNLTAEDLRLVLCGTETVSLSLMQSYTAWTDESHAVPETIEKFKQWFWQVADRLSPQEKSDLIFFWTGAPSLPSTEEGFQPMPTIVIRPTDDGFLPTANTCISRLYLPLYNSKKILTAKLQLAIKAKNFGFV